MNPIFDFLVHLMILLLDRTARSPSLPRPLRAAGLFLTSLIFLFLIGFSGWLGFQAWMALQRQSMTTAVFLTLFTVGLVGFCLLLLRSLQTAMRQTAK
ncbi:hypothetical protein [Holdemania massiliensis]|uniref:hypothetical protein n=1 Tax=Holdemania massiliensis TaxID=1468449 RepID=UPI0026768EEF|nr:hypothetical protein [Holdemania massiliensis]